MKFDKVFKATVELFFVYFVSPYHRQARYFPVQIRNHDFRNFRPCLVWWRNYSVFYMGPSRYSTQWISHWKVDKESKKNKFHVCVLFVILVSYNCENRVWTLVYLWPIAARGASSGKITSIVINYDVFFQFIRRYLHRICRYIIILNYSNVFD